VALRSFQSIVRLRGSDMSASCSANGMRLGRGFTTVQKICNIYEKKVCYAHIDFYINIYIYFYILTILFDYIF